MLESESLSKDTSINKIDFQLQVPENTIKINENRTMPEDNLILRPNVKEETHNYLEMLPVEILEEIFFRALYQLDNTFPNHVCWTFNNAVAAIPRLTDTCIRKAIGLLPRIYLRDNNVLPKSSTKDFHVNVKRLRQSYGIHSGLIREIKRTVNCSK